MNVTFEKTGDLTAQLKVAVVESDYREQVDKEIKKIGRDHVIPGFRKGHVPFGELRRRFGKEVTSDVLNRIVYDAVIAYLRDNKIDILGEPMAENVVELDLANKTDFDFTFNLGLAPKFDFKIDKDINVPYYEIAVSDEMVEEQNKALRKRFGAQVPGEEFETDALVKGVLMELNEDGTVKEGEDAIQVIDGIVAPFLFKSKEEAARFEGKKVGDKVVFNPWATCEGNPTELASMLHLDNKEKAAEVKNNFELAISEMIVVRPAELNEEFFNQVFGPDKVHNEEEYFKALREMIASSLEPNSQNLLAGTLKKDLMGRYGNFELPNEFLIAWLGRKNSEVAPEQVAADYEKMKDDLRWQLLTSYIANQLGVEVNEQDMMEFAKVMARHQFAQYGMTNLDEETVTKYARSIMDDKNYRSRLFDQVFEGKFFDAVSEAVTLDKLTVSLEEFKAIAEKL